MGALTTGEPSLILLAHPSAKALAQVNKLAKERGGADVLLLCIPQWTAIGPSIGTLQREHTCSSVSLKSVNKALWGRGLGPLGAQP